LCNATITRQFTDKPHVVSQFVEWSACAELTTCILDDFQTTHCAVTVKKFHSESICVILIFHQLFLQVD